MEEHITAVTEEAAVKTPQGLSSESRSLCETSQESGESDQKGESVPGAKPRMLQ